MGKFRNKVAVALVTVFAGLAIFTSTAGASKYESTNSCSAPGGGIGNAYYHANSNYHSAVSQYGYYCYYG